MNFSEYQKISARTVTPSLKNEILCYGLGISGEAGEVTDLIKKVYFHGHKLDKQDMAKELGDVMWYISQIASFENLDLAEIAQLNINKLKKRYPHGFSTEDSIKRVDTKETQ
ncbi:nucleoside triphosphate pyrophosphohydrolase family protein [Liquorilactobacillus oeni]|uniref:NTP pyrophosphohydrolase MazG-like domain-containing protein n=1 Tax=Liquorilactobacillus oeni DSM 19972 TaxID=1423777 RepID=A0A0R1MFN8_9LACO|nr:nucleoside triphosphate pyrophosphohydrolase family protein [Liquorilactobacillus oeni]KRL04133.1 hypothetical protein FD46_GL001250 [Liquorilactobacillus oeni DSM 19972]